MAGGADACPAVVGADRAHARRAQDTFTHHVAGLHDDVEACGFDLVAARVHECLVLLRVELFAFLAEARESVRAKRFLKF